MNTLNAIASHLITNINKTPDITINSALVSSSVNSVDFMQAVAHQTKLLESGLRDLRTEISDPLRVVDLGQEAIILSGLNQKAGDSLKHIKNLYEETKYLKTYLEKVRQCQSTELDSLNIFLASWELAAT